MIAESLNALIGKVGEVTIMAVEKGAIKRFADAVGDRNPLYWDEEYARHSRHGTIVAPPGFFGWPVKWTTAMPFLVKLREEAFLALAEAGFDRALDGGMEYEFHRPVRAGDTLVAVPKVVDISEREGRTGKMVILVLETTYTNQHGDLVARARQTTIHR